MNVENGPRTAVVLGSTGLVGTRLVKVLAESNVFSEIVAPSRRRLDNRHPKVKSCIVDFERLGQYSDLLVGSCLFLCLGATRKQAGSLAAQRKVDVEYQYSAARLAANNGVRDCLLLSSLGANPTSASSYLRFKGELESQIKLLPFKRIAIFRPSFLLGRRDDSRALESAAAKMMYAVRFLPGLSRYSPVDAHIVAKVMVEEAKKEEIGLRLYLNRRKGLVLA